MLVAALLGLNPVAVALAALELRLGCKLASCAGEAVGHVRHAAALHRVGKMAIPDAILGKPGPLHDAEWASSGATR
ncbi:MAG: hypothetical protein M3P44_11180 [Actinomycetota bacterium]|nr:hypothetical protein [Actinomycetota bacterium]